MASLVDSGAIRNAKCQRFCPDQHVARTREGDRSLALLHSCKLSLLETVFVATRVSIFCESVREQCTDV